MRYLLHLVLALVLTLAVSLPAARAQNAPPAQDGGGEEKAVKVPALQYTVAFLLTMLILMIVCMPSRKSVQSD